MLKKASSFAFVTSHAWSPAAQVPPPCATVPAINAAARAARRGGKKRKVVARVRVRFVVGTVLIVLCSHDTWYIERGHDTGRMDVRLYLAVLQEMAIDPIDDVTEVFFIESQKFFFFINIQLNSGSG